MPLPTGSRIFDGIDDHLDNGANFDLSATNVATFLSRVYFEAWGGVSILAEFTYAFSSFAGAWAIGQWYDAPTTAAVMMSSGSPVLVHQRNITVPPTLGAWHALGVVFDRASSGSSEIKVYLDGALVGTTWISTSTGGFATTDNCSGNFTNQPLFLASRQGAVSFWKGRLSDVAVYTSALSAADIAAFAHGMPGDSFGSPKGYWPLNGVANPEPDLSGNGYHLTVYGATAGGAPDVIPGGDPVITIAGTVRSSSTRVYNEAVTIRDVLDHVPNTCELTVDGTEPPIGAEVKIGLGGVSTLAQLLFAGHVRQVRQVYEGQKAENVAWRVSCIDDTWLLNRRKVITQYPSQSATTTIIHLIANYTSGFTTTKVTAGLATLDPITFTNEEPADCLTRICKLLGAYWYVDYLKDVHVFLTESTDLPANITDANPQGAAAIESVEDLSQIRTRVYVEGGGAQAARDAVVGATVLYVDDPSWYNASGGTVVVGAQRVTYTGKSTAVITPGTSIASPPGAPAAAVASGSGLLAGTYRYRYTRQNDAGETTGSPASSPAVVPASVTVPTAPGASESGTLGNLSGTYFYRTTFVTAAGETLLGAASANVTPDAWATPTAPARAELAANGPLVGNYLYRISYVTALGETLPGAATTAIAVTAWAAGGAGMVLTESNTVGPLAGAYDYKISNVTPLGETLPGTTAAFGVTPDVAAAPGAISTTEGSSAIGPLYGGSYTWATTFVNPYGETLKGTTTSRTPTTHAAPTTWNLAMTTGGALTLLGVYKWHYTFVSEFGETTGNSSTGTATLTGSSNAMILGNLGTLLNGPPGTIARRIYRTRNGGSEFLLVHTIPNNTGSSYTDGVADIDLGERMPDLNTFGGYEVTVTNIDTGPTGTTARKIYRTKKGGAVYYLGGVLPNNTATTFVDDVPDSALVENEPSVNTAGGEKVILSSIPTGPTGTIARRIYRTKAGGSVFFYVDEIQNNSAGISYTDEIPDSALQPAPLASTAGGHQVRLSSIDTGPAGTLTRRIYRTKAGGSTYYLIDELPNNTDTTYDDAIPDSALTRPAPSVSTAGGEQVLLSSIDTAPAAAGVVARRIYRTKAGGSEYLYLDQLSDNTTTTYTDNVPDANLTQHPPLVNTAGGQKVSLSSISAGPSGTIARKIYRTKNGGTSYFYLDSLDDNTTTTYTDNKPDDQLGALLPTTNTTAGTAETLDTLTGIPPSGTGSIRFAIPKGEQVNILITRNSTTAQTALAALVGGDGIHEHYLQDGRLAETECIARGDAELAAFKDPIVTVTFTTRDPNATAGKAITFALGAPTNLSGTFKIQDVTISQIGQLPGVLPLRTVTASSQRFSLEDLLRQRRGVAAWAA